MDTTNRVGFWEWAQAEPWRPALVGDKGERLTFGQLFDEVNKLSHGLRDVANVGYGDVVASVMTNSPGFVELYMATMQSGMYLATLNYHLTEPEIRYILEDCGAKIVVATERFAEQVAAAISGLDIVLYVDGDYQNALSFSTLFEGQPSTLPKDRPAGSPMQYTSGTTGRPKGVKRPLSGKSAEEGAQVHRWIFEDYGMKPGDNCVWLVAAPMYHQANVSSAMGVLHFGYCIVLMDGWSPEKCLEVIQRERVNYTHMVPTQFIRMLQLPDEVRLSYDVSSLQIVTHGAAPCPLEVKKKMFDWLGPVLYEYYGSTEVGATMARPHEWLARPGTVGRPSSVSELKIMDEDGEELPPGEVGLIFMRMGDDVMEYHNDPGKTASIRRGRFLTVGDLGYVDDDGYLFLAGRAVELIISGGVNIYPAEIEGVLIGHPAVFDMVVAGQADEVLGEVPIALIELRPGFVESPELAEDILEYCRSRLSRQKMPREIRFVDSLPRDENGKIFKKKLNLGESSDAKST